MKTITKTFNVYTIDELKEVSENGFNKAIEDERDVYSEINVQHLFDDMQETIEKVADFLNITISGYNYGVYNYRKFIGINKETYLDLDNTSKKEIVKKVNDFIIDKNKFDCEFSGIWTDFYFIEYFEKNNIKKVTFNDLHKNFEDLFYFMISKFCEDMEKEIEDDNLILEIIRENDYLYKENGELYKEVA